MYLTLCIICISNACGRVKAHFIRASAFSSVQFSRSRSCITISVSRVRPLAYHSSYGQAYSSHDYQFSFKSNLRCYHLRLPSLSQQIYNNPHSLFFAAEFCLMCFISTNVKWILANIRKKKCLG